MCTVFYVHYIVPASLGLLAVRKLTISNHRSLWQHIWVCQLLIIFCITARTVHERTRNIFVKFRPPKMHWFNSQDNITYKKSDLFHRGCKYLMTSRGARSERREERGRERREAVSRSASRESRGKSREALHVDTCARKATRERNERATCTHGTWGKVCHLYRAREGRASEGAEWQFITRHYRLHICTIEANKNTWLLPER